MSALIDRNGVALSTRNHPAIPSTPLRPTPSLSVPTSTQAPTPTTTQAPLASLIGSLARELDTRVSFDSAEQLESALVDAIEPHLARMFEQGYRTGWQHARTYVDRTL